MTQIANRFTFKSPNVFVLENGCSENIGQYLEKLNSERILIVTDEVMTKIGVTERIQNAIESSGLTAVVFDKSLPEPPVENAMEALESYRSENCNAVVGVGGGSALDVAKIVAMLATNEGDFMDFAGIGKVPNKCAPLVLLPTTAGTGSELSIFSIMIVNGSKVGVVDQNILADYALVDPQLTVSVPRAITAATGIDALCHHIESLLSSNASPFCDAICLEGIRVINKYLRQAVGNGKNTNARYWMSYASSLGGYVMNLTEGAAGVHALAFALGAKFNVGHGLSNAVMLPYVFPVIGSVELDKVEKIGQAMGLELEGIPQREVLDYVSETIMQLVSDVGCLIPLSEFGVEEKDLDMLVTEALTQTRVLGHSTYDLTAPEMKEIFANAL